jgi:hypothetical protein
MPKSPLLLFAACIAALAALPASADAMAAYKWKKRPLLVFAPSPDDGRIAEQRGRLDSTALADRDMVVVVVAGDSVQASPGPGPGLTAAELRRRYDVGSGEFRTILVGKDGGVKRSSPRPLSRNAVFGLIDAMPMRRQEMRRRG